MIDTLTSIARRIAGIPIGLFLILTGVLYVLFWKIPETLGSDFAAKGVDAGYDAIATGKDWMGGK